MKKYRNMIITVILAILFVVAGCNTEASQTTTTQTANNTAEMSCADDTCISTMNEVQKVEVIHFHATQQCYSCKTVGAYAEETMNTYFANEIKFGKVTFAHINVDLPENRELVNKYGVTGSSLWIGVYDSNGFHKEENVNVWYKISNKQDYMNYLKGVIEQKLRGD